MRLFVRGILSSEERAGVRSDVNYFKSEFRRGNGQTGHARKRDELVAPQHCEGGGERFS
jgi:hypothetical protein